MDREQLLSILRSHISALRQRGVKGLALFGPVARNEGKPGSPVDFLLQLDPPHTFDQLLEIKLYLAELLNRPVELVVASPHHPEIWPYVEEDVVPVMGMGD